VSSAILVLIILAVLGILICIGFLYLTRSRTGGLSSSLSSGLGGTIGSYGEIRQQLLRETPENVPLEPIAVTSANVVLLVEAYEGEVNNGGLDQFFFNSSGEYALETIQALEHIKANKAASILREACERFPDGRPPKDILERRSILVSTISPNSVGFEDLDTRFYDYEDDLGQLLEDYRKENPL